MTLKVLNDGTTYVKAHAHDWEDPECLLTGTFDVFIKIDGIRAIKNKDGQAWSRDSKPILHVSHLDFKDAEIFRGSWNETSSILGSNEPPAVPLTQENVYELSDGCVDKRLHLGRCTNPSNENLRKKMLQMLELGHEGLILRQKTPKGFKWWKIVPYKYADVKITGMKEGKGALAGMCGSIQSDYGSAGSMVKDSLVDFGIAEDNIAIRTWLWKNRASLVGTVMQVRYREMTSGGKFRFPSLVRLRRDKSDESLD